MCSKEEAKAIREEFRDRFMYEKIMRLEEFFREYRDFLKYG